jgi:hypothetical protein
VAPLCSADSLRERRDLVVRHPARTSLPHSSTAKTVAFCERGKNLCFHSRNGIRKKDEE